jgi:hypothetical protein
MPEDREHTVNEIKTILVALGYEARIDPDPSGRLFSCTIEKEGVAKMNSPQEGTKFHALMASLSRLIEFLEHKAYPVK